ncbi:MAG: hypothetical protein C5B47_02820 [Verrucomicrobia bacterium]|nr:MAG: hypothetical protein C5B47_02820 [Verrucomicrobiota bacterium]
MKCSITKGAALLQSGVIIFFPNGVAQQEFRNKIAIPTSGKIHCIWFCGRQISFGAKKLCLQ